MTLRDDLLAAGRRAAAVLDDAQLSDRLAQGFTRVDPFAIAAVAAVPIIVRPLDKLLGAFLREEQPGIILNSARPAGLVHMTCAHELGHYFMGHQSTSDQSIDYSTSASLVERQADLFAYSLLMPRRLLNNLMKIKGWGATSFHDPVILYQLSLRLGMSYTGAVWSLHRQNLLTYPQAKALAAVQPVDLKRGLTAEVLHDPVNQDVWLLDSSDRDLILEPRKDDRFTIDLPNRAGAGYLWTVTEAAHQGFTLRPVLVDGRQQGPESDDVLVGGRRSLRYSLEHASTELTSMALNFREAQPWRPSTTRGESFAVSTQLETITLGLTPEARQRLVKEVADQ